MLTTLSQPIYCIAVSGASDYQYKIENNALGFVAEVYRNSTLNDFRLTWLPVSTGGLRYNTTYNVSVRAKVGGLWLNYGPACQITTPAQPLTQIQAAYCPYNLPTFGSLVYCIKIEGATNYRYHISGPSGFDRTVMRNSPGNDFNSKWSLVCCGGRKYVPKYHLQR
ncbi:MAG: hypothetical protein IPO70_14990 [Bacteroidetes bacterium]|nr:hypothetical protein [Bacteroidota bacterium]